MADGASVWIHQVRREKLSTGANVEAQDNQGMTPLIWAAAIGREAMVKLLLDAGKPCTFNPKL